MSYCFMDKYNKHYDGYGACIKAAKGEVLLFLDGNFSLSTNEMQGLLSQLLQIKPM